jgi:hypothetical protein
LQRPIKGTRNPQHRFQDARVWRWREINRRKIALKVFGNPFIRSVTFEETPARTRTVSDADAAGRALLTHGDITKKEYRTAVRSLVALSEGRAAPEQARADFIAALRVSGVFVHDP